MLDAPFGADDDRHAVNRIGIEGRGQADRLGKLGGPVGRDAMQRLAPPVVGRNIQPRNRARLIHQLRDLLFDRHAVDQIRGPLLRRQCGVQIGRLRGVCACKPLTVRKAKNEIRTREFRVFISFSNENGSVAVITSVSPTSGISRVNLVIDGVPFMHNARQRDKGHSLIL